MTKNTDDILKVFKRFEDFLMATNQISKSVQKIKTREMKEFGLKGAHVMLLFQLKSHQGKATQAELVQWCKEDKAAISRSLGELEKLQLIGYEDDETVNKKYKLKVLLTEKGEEVTDKMGGKIMNAVEHASQGYTDNERENFYNVLFQVAENLHNTANEQ